MSIFFYLFIAFLMSFINICCSQRGDLTMNLCLTVAFTLDYTIDDTNFKM